MTAKSQSLNPNKAVAALFPSKKSDIKSIEDHEFGSISVRRNANAKYVRLRMKEDGDLSVTLPRFASIKHAEDIIESSRSKIRDWKSKQVRKQTVFLDGDRIGRSHVIKFAPANIATPKISLKKLEIQVNHPVDVKENNPQLQSAIKPYINKALQKEARAYLPRRLKYLADEYGFKYQRVRYGTQKGRWGSCSSSGTISLNVGLMLLDADLIDYVLVHELCHTKQMNHSANFWSLVENILPDYKTRRKNLKTKNPTI